MHYEADLFLWLANGSLSRNVSVAGMLDNCTDSPPSEPLLDQFDRIINAFLLPIIASFGCAGSIGTITVLSRSQLWKSLRYYLIAVAVWDIALLLSSVTLFSLAAWQAHGFIDSLGSSTLYAYPYQSLFANFCFVGHLWTTIALTFERYLAICYPFWHRSTVKPRLTAAVCLGGVLLFSICFTIPRFWETEVIYCYNTHISRLEGRPVNSELIDDPVYVFYRITGSLLFTSVGPFCILIILTLRMVTTIRKSLGTVIISRRQQTTHTNPRRPFQRLKTRSFTSRLDMRSHRPLVAVLLTSIACYSLPTVVDVIQFSFDENVTSMLNYLSLISNLLVVINASAPFFIYLLSSERFRQQARRNFGCCNVLRGHTSLTDLRTVQFTERTDPAQVALGAGEAIDGNLLDQEEAGQPV